MPIDFSQFQEWYPQDLALDYWEPIMGFRWTPDLIMDWHHAQRLALNCIKYLRENPPSLANQDFRLRIQGYLRYARWSMHWDYIHPYQPEAFALLRSMAPYLIGAAALAAAVWIAHNWQAAHARSDETVLQLLEQIDSFEGEYPLDTDLYHYFLPFQQHKDLSETVLGTKGDASLGQDKSYGIYLPTRSAQTLHYAATAWILEPVIRKNLLLLVALKLHNNALPRRFALTLHIPTIDGNIAITLAMFNPPQGSSWILELLPSTRPVTVLPNLGEWKGLQYYFLNIDLTALEVTDILIQNWLETGLHIPIQHYPGTPVTPPYLWIDVTSEINRDARLEIRRILVANWGPPFIHHYIAPQNLKDPPDWQTPLKLQPNKHPTSTEKFGYKYFPSAQVPAQPQPWDAYKPPWIK